MFSYLFRGNVTNDNQDKYKISEPVFVDLLRSPGIDSQPDGTVRQTCLSYRPARRHRLVESISRNQFLGSIIVYKYQLEVKIFVLWRRRLNVVFGGVVVGGR
jgi:hypothetical protein